MLLLFILLNFGVSFLSDLVLNKILGIEKKSTQADIKKAYRKLARKYHPDLNPNDKDSEKKFKEIMNTF